MVLDVFWEKQPGTRITPEEDPTYAALKEYKEVPETVPLEL